MTGSITIMEMNLNTADFFIVRCKAVKNEPTFIEVFLTKLVFIFCGKSVYRSFAESLHLDGGMGTVAYYVAKRLPHGELTCMDISERWLEACRKTLRRFENVTFLKWESPVLAKESYDVVFCHFVLHDIPEDELEYVIPVLTESLKSGGVLVFREPLKNTKKVNIIKQLIEQKALSLKNSHITDIPVMGNTLESVYVKK
jgi:trans-aconitate methyltransferase